MITLQPLKSIEHLRELKAMTNKNNPLQVVFAPGCFDNFDGTQEELDELVAEIQNMFANKTREELEAESCELSDEDWGNLSDEEKHHLANAIMETEEDRKRKLQ